MCECVCPLVYQVKIQVRGMYRGHTLQVRGMYRGQTVQVRGRYRGPVAAL